MDRWCWQRGFKHSNSDGCGTNPNITCATNISKEVEKFSSQLETLCDFPGLSVCDDKAWPGRPRGGQLQASQQKRFRAFSGWSCRLGMELRSGPQGARLPKLFCISGPGTSVLNSLCGSLSKIFPRSLCQDLAAAGGRDPWRHSSTLTQSSGLSQTKPCSLLSPGPRVHKTAGPFGSCLLQRWEDRDDPHISSDPPDPQPVWQASGEREQGGFDPCLRLISSCNLPSQ